MQYQEITIYTTTQASELVADILSDLGSKGVGIYDSADYAQLLASEVIWDYIDEQLLIDDPTVRVKGYFTQEEYTATVPLLRERLNFLAENCPFEYGSLEFTSQEVDDLDWVNAWKKDYRPIRAGKVIIVPDWIAYSPQNDDEVIVTMDPGMAFGTGEHETTRLCLQYLQQSDLAGLKIADVGTGSGILAIAAVKLGADRVDAFDIDEIAVKAARANASANRVSDRVAVELADLLSDAREKYDLVIANITADILIQLSGQLRSYLKTGGCAIVSGIIHARAKDVERGFEENGFAIESLATDGEWRAYRMRKIR